MEPVAEQLVVRQHERRACSVAATVRLDTEHGSIVALARSVGDGTGVMAAKIVDVSSGGTGLELAVFLPRGARVIVSVRLGDGAPIEVPSRVQRVKMVSREPRYYLGLSYAGDPEAKAGTLGKLLAGIDAGEAADKEPRR